MTSILHESLNAEDAEGAENRVLRDCFQRALPCAFDFVRPRHFSVQSLIRCAKFINKLGLLGCTRATRPAEGTILSLFFADLRIS
jgi:hypothetical protein